MGFQPNLNLDESSSDKADDKTRQFPVWQIPAFSFLASWVQFARHDKPRFIRVKLGPLKMRGPICLNPGGADGSERSQWIVV